MTGRLARISGIVGLTVVASISTLPALAASVSVPNYGGTSSARASYTKIAPQYPSGAYDRHYESGSMSSHNNYPLYFQGTVGVINEPDLSCGRISNDTGSGGGSANGTCDAVHTNPIKLAGYLTFKVCRNIANQPDPCGSSSGKSYR